MKIYEAPEVYQKIISEKESGDEQVRLTINEFKGVEYIHLRKYYLDFDGEFKPTKHGVAMPLTFENSLAEAKEILKTHFKDILDEIYLS